MTTEERAEQLLEECQTPEQWREAYEWLLSQYDEALGMYFHLEEAIVEKYGVEAFEQLQARAAVTFTAEESAEKQAASDAQIIRDFGYTKEGMIMLTEESARNLLEQGKKVYLLYSNDTEKEVTDPAQLDGCEDALIATSQEEMEKVADEVFSLIS